jgi:hypothetical protein
MTAPLHYGPPSTGRSGYSYRPPYHYPAAYGPLPKHWTIRFRCLRWAQVPGESRSSGRPGCCRASACGCPKLCAHALTCRFVARWNPA